MKCVKCREERPDTDLFISPVGWLCGICLKALLNWVEVNKETLEEIKANL